MRVSRWRNVFVEQEIAEREKLEQLTDKELLAYAGRKRDRDHWDHHLSCLAAAGRRPHPD
jgi:hypothetical protein